MRHGWSVRPITRRKTKGRHQPSVRPSVFSVALCLLCDLFRSHTLHYPTAASFPRPHVTQNFQCASSSVLHAGHCFFVRSVPQCGQNVTSRPGRAAAQ